MSILIDGVVDIFLSINSQSILLKKQRICVDLRFHQSVRKKMNELIDDINNG